MITADVDLQPLLEDLRQRFPNTPLENLIIVSATKQLLYLIKDNNIVSSYPISTAKAGLGSLSGSFKTPLGIHRIQEKIGEDAAPGTIFKGRKNTQVIAKILLDPNKFSNEDNITSRILWLSGMEQGVNLGGDVDSYNRYIYIHGTDEEGQLGKPSSHGCIRMSNHAVIELFEQVDVGTLVCVIE